MSRDYLEAMSKARRDKYGSCGVLGCLKSSKKDCEYCFRHEKYKRDEKCFVKPGIPASFRERMYLAFQYTQFLVRRLNQGDITEDKLRTDFMRVVYPILREKSPAALHRKAVATDSGAIFGNMDQTPFKRLINETRRHFWMYRKEPMLGILMRMPYEFQVGEVTEENEFLKVTLLMRVDHTFDDFRGYLSSRGGFLPKDAIKLILDDAFNTGRLVLLSCQKSSLHKPPGCRGRSPQRKAEIKEERKTRRMMYPPRAPRPPGSAAD